MKARLLAIAAALVAVSGIFFVNWNDASVMIDAVEIVDFSSCSASPCNTQNCQAAARHLADAGSPCVLRLAECDARKQDGGARYWHVEVTALRCPVMEDIFVALELEDGGTEIVIERQIKDGGGFSWAVALDDAGQPLDTFNVKPFPCAWKPNAGATCGRVNPDGGAALDPGVENTMQPGQWIGGGCIRKACVEIAGDSSAP